MKKQTEYSTKRIRTAKHIWMMLGVVAIGVFLGIAAVCCIAIGSIGSAKAEETRDCWVMCRPGSDVMIREKPGKRARAVGAACSGAHYTTDDMEADGWIHLVGVANETGEGWIFGGYIVYREPERVDAERTIRSNGRVALRRWIGGKRTGWIRDGQKVRVYWMTGKVAVTDRGFIAAEYIGGE